MLKKLSEAQLERLLEAGVEAFSLHGPAGGQAVKEEGQQAGVHVPAQIPRRLPGGDGAPVEPGGSPLASAPQHV